MASKAMTRLYQLRKLKQSSSPVQRCLCTKVTEDKQKKLDDFLLSILVCLLSKKPLRYNEETNELVNDELGVAYPIVNGIPNLVPEDGRIINKDTTDKAE